MITWLDNPIKGTDKQRGFEVLVHGFFLTAGGTDEVKAIVVEEDGRLGACSIRDVALDWRYKRGKGWHSLEDVEE